MATLASILGPAQERGTKIAALAALTSSAEQAVGGGKFVVVGDTAFTIRFGRAGMAAADATDLLIPANQLVTFDLLTQFTSFRAFNTASAATANIYWLRLSQF